MEARSDAPVVFVSHSSVDAEVANAIVTQLEARAVKCWIAPRDMTPGPLFATALYEAIEHAPVVLVLLSLAANSSEHVAREVALAHQMRKSVIPIMLEQITTHQMTGALCYYTRVAHYYRWHTAPQEALERIVAEVERIRAENKPTG